MKKVPEEMSRDLPRQYQTKLFSFNAQMLVQSESSSTHGNVQSLGRFTSDHLQPQQFSESSNSGQLTAFHAAQKLTRLYNLVIVCFFLVTLL